MRNERWKLGIEDEKRKWANDSVYTVMLLRLYESMRACSGDECKESIE